jgi:hypothetical protein
VKISGGALGVEAKSPLLMFIYGRWTESARGNLPKVNSAAETASVLGAKSKQQKQNARPNDRAFETLSVQIS